MTPTDRPLHVRVAEALGWTDCGLATPVPGQQHFYGVPPDKDGSHWLIPRFDTDWSATGPEIEKYGVEIYPYYHLDENGAPEVDRWNARSPQTRTPAELGDGPTPLTAVCELLIKLGEAGKLEKP